MHDTFIHEFNGVQYAVHTENIASGRHIWRDIVRAKDLAPACVIACIAMVTKETTSAMDAVMDHEDDAWLDRSVSSPLTAALARIVIRCMDLAGALHLPLAEAIAQQVAARPAANEKRFTRNE